MCGSELTMGTLTAPSFERGIEVYRGEKTGFEPAAAERWGQLRIPQARGPTNQTLVKMASIL